MYINNTDCRIAGTNEYKTFRRRFGVTFDLFREFVNTARSWGIFSEKPDAVGRQPVPLELKVLGALRMVAKGCAFDAIAELSSMGLSTMQQFFHTFWDKFVAHYKPQYIKYPRTAEEAAPVISEFKRLGFDGCVGSLDVTHIEWGRVPAGMANLYTGKEKYPTVGYEVVVDHHKKILYVSRGFPGSASDKEIIKTDDYVQEVRKKKILYDDVTFELKDAQGNPRVWQGAWFITDNGYAKWRILQAPLKHCRNYDEHKWSERLESVRKNIECTFGILKVRFRILSSKVLFQFQEYVDTVFYAACIMHNMLHAEDGYDEPMVFQSADDDDLREALEARRIRLDSQRVREIPIVPPRVEHRRGLRGSNDDDDSDDEFVPENNDTHFALRDALIAHYMYERPGWLVRPWNVT